MVRFKCFFQYNRLLLVHEELSVDFVVYREEKLETVVVEIVLFGIVEFEIVGLGIVEFEMFNIVSLDGIQTYLDIFVISRCLLDIMTVECLAAFGNFEFLTC